METNLNEVGLSQGHKAAPLSCHSPLVGGVPPALLPRLYTNPGNSAGIDALGNGQVSRHADICA